MLLMLHSLKNLLHNKGPNEMLFKKGQKGSNTSIRAESSGDVWLAPAGCDLLTHEGIFSMKEEIDTPKPAYMQDDPAMFSCFPARKD